MSIKAMTTEDFIEKSRRVHGDKYDYSKTEYISHRHKVIITCPIHGDFEVLPSSHSGGRRTECSKCALISRSKRRIDRKLKELQSYFDNKNIVLPENSKALPLGGENYVIVDEADYEDLIKINWCKFTNHRNSYYALGTFFIEGGGNKAMFLHRYLLGLEDGDPRVGDHINGNPRDNRRCNIRIATLEQNAQNSAPVNNKVCPYKGVWYHKNMDKTPWVAEFKPNYTKINIGYAATPEEAARMYDAEAFKYYGEFAWLNFPEDYGLLPRKKTPSIYDIIDKSKN